MSRTRALFLVTAATVAFGCRYSSSETPPPLEPDFDRLRRAETPVTGAGGDAARPGDAARLDREAPSAVAPATAGAAPR